MNPAHFTDWEIAQTQYWVDQGVPRAEAEAMAKWMRNESERLIRETRDQRQYLIDFKEMGSRRIAERDRVTQQSARNRYNKIVNKAILQPCFATKFST